jgi:hypothetical protein
VFNFAALSHPFIGALAITKVWLFSAMPGAPELIPLKMLNS